MTDTIKRGDRVSWQSSTGYEPRQFGRVAGPTVLDRGTPFARKAFRVTGVDGIGRIVPARFITKEIG